MPSAIPMGRVLVVDGQPSACEFYAPSLTAAGFEVAEARGAAEALRRIESDKFDVVLCDIPEIDSLRLLRSIRERCLQARVILVLNEADNRIAVQATQLGAVQWLVKPVDVESLRETVAYAAGLGGARPSPHDAFSRWAKPLESAAPVTATHAKKEFGRVLDRVMQDGLVVITKHDDPKAVLISIDRFEALSNAAGAKLDTLSGEFDALLARMQTTEARAGMKLAFGASPKQLGKAALAAVRRRG